VLKHHSTRGWKTTKRFKAQRGSTKFKAENDKKKRQWRSRKSAGKKKDWMLSILKAPHSLLLSFYEMQMEP